MHGGVPLCIPCIIELRVFHGVYVPERIVIEISPNSVRLLKRGVYDCHHGGVNREILPLILTSGKQTFSHGT